MSYDEDRLYCLSCKEQPDHFDEVMAWQVNRVTPEGTMIEVKDGELLEYRCPQCHGGAEWGHELRTRTRRSSK